IEGREVDRAVDDIRRVAGGVLGDLRGPEVEELPEAGPDRGLAVAEDIPCNADADRGKNRGYTPQCRGQQGAFACPYHAGKGSRRGGIAAHRRWHEGAGESEERSGPGLRIDGDLVGCGTCLGGRGNRAAWVVEPHGLGGIVGSADPIRRIVGEILGRQLMVETNPQIESHARADAPVILHEGLYIRVPVIAYHAPAFGVAAELSKKSVGVPVLRVVRHSRGTGKVIGTQVRAGGLVLFHFAGPLVVEPGLDIVFAPHLADGVVEAIDIVPIGGGAYTISR